MNCTVATEGKIAKLSVTSVLEKVAVPEVVEVTVKTTIPWVFETPEAGEILSVAPLIEVSVMVFPGTGFPSVSLAVTVMVVGVVPSAVTEVGDATKVELEGLIEPEAGVVIDEDDPE